jgi:hypothetical protein
MHCSVIGYVRLRACCSIWQVYPTGDLNSPSGQDRWETPQHRWPPLKRSPPGTSVAGVLAGGPVTVVAVQWYGSTALDLTYKDEASGKTDSRLLYRSDEPGLSIVRKGRAWAYDGDGRLFRLVSEASRIRNAALFDTQLAVSVSQSEALPHQLSAVYEEMLPRQPLRYLLADDPGAGKTIMAGLLIKELMLRGDIERFLILCPDIGTCPKVNRQRHPLRPELGQQLTVQPHTLACRCLFRPERSPTLKQTGILVPARSSSENNSSVKGLRILRHFQR